MKRKAPKRKVDLDLHLPRWVDAMPWDDPHDLKHEVIHLLFEVERARRAKGPLKTRQVTDAHATAQGVLNAVRAGTLHGARGVRRIETVDTRLRAAMAAAYDATLVTCPRCDSLVTPEAMIRAAERRTKERKPTGCLGCAAPEKRPYLLTIEDRAAVSAIFDIVNKHCDAALDVVPDGTMVDVDELRIIGELFTREAKRLGAGGTLPRFRWRVLGKTKKGKR
jgi:hypothetical protein